MKRYYSIIITSNSGDFIKRFNISHKRWKIIRALLVIFFIAVFISAGFYSRLYLLALKARALEVENQALREENAKVKELEKKLYALEELRVKILSMLGVDQAPKKEMIFSGQQQYPSEQDTLSDSARKALGKVSSEFRKYATILYDDERFLPRGKPVEGYISQSYTTGHSGIDIVTPIGTPVKAPADGIVLKIGEDRLLGLTLTLAHGSKYETYYGHLKEILVKEGQVVKKGDIIALSGNSGISTGPHLHYEIRYLGKNVNPENYLY
jgi:murein DD-endopeptidase MepM/ murein hydrolase activator NlpD